MRVCGISVAQVVEFWPVPRVLTALWIGGATPHHPPYTHAQLIHQPMPAEVDEQRVSFLGLAPLNAVLTRCSAFLYLVQKLVSGCGAWLSGRLCQALAR